MDNTMIWSNYRIFSPTQLPSNLKLVEKEIEYTWVGCFDSQKEARETAKRFKLANTDEKIKWRCVSTCIKGGLRKIYSFNLYINVTEKENVLYENKWCKVLGVSTYYVLRSKSDKYNDQHFSILLELLKTIGIQSYTMGNGKVIPNNSKFF